MLPDRVVYFGGRGLTAPDTPPLFILRYTQQVYRPNQSDGMGILTAENYNDDMRPLVSLADLILKSLCCQKCMDPSFEVRQEVYLTQSVHTFI